MKFNACVGDQHKFIALNHHGHDVGATHVEGVGNIPTFRIDDLELDRCDLIQLDTEGYEYEVLKGALKTINKFAPKYIQLEYNWHHLFKNINLYHFSILLPKYNVFKILPFGSELIKIDTARPENNYFNYSNIVFQKK
jgi:hypothetical protein